MKKDIQNIFDEEYRKACLSSHISQQCFNNTKIGAAFRNEKKLGTLISKSKLLELIKHKISLGRHSFSL